MVKFKFLGHTADVKFQAFGKNISELFENSALATKEAICGKIKIRGTKEKVIKIKGKDFESLMYKFLEEILYLLDSSNFLVSKIKEIKVKDFTLSAVLLGGNAKDYWFTNSVKAVTYNEMFIKKQKGRWVSQVVLDV